MIIINWGRTIEYTCSRIIVSYDNNLWDLDWFNWTTIEQLQQDNRCPRIMRNRENNYYNTQDLVRNHKGRVI